MRPERSDTSDDSQEHGASFFVRHPFMALGIAFLVSMGLFLGAGSILPILTVPFLVVALVLIGYFAFANFPKKEYFVGSSEYNLKKTINAVMGIIAIIIMVWLFFASMMIVPAGHKGVLVTTPNGNNYDELNEGWTFNPYYIFCSKEIIRYNTQQESFVGSDESSDNAGSIMVSSADNVGIYVDFSIVYHLDPENVADLRIGAGDYKQSVLIPVARSVPRDVCAQYTALEIRGERRSVVEQGIRENITIRLAEKSIIVEMFALRDIRLPALYEDAIVKKKVAEQNVLTEQYNLLAQQYVANQSIINATAQAEALIINATAQANATVIMASGRAEAVEIVMAKLNSTAGNATTDYLRFLYISALNDPNCNIQYIVIPTEGGTPILLQIPQEKK